MGTLAFEVNRIHKSALKSEALSLHCIASEHDFSFLLDTDDSADGYLVKSFAYAKRERPYLDPLREFRGILKKTPQLFRSFHKVVVGFRGTPCMIMPTHAGNVHQVEDRLRQNAHVGPGDRISIDRMPAHNLQVAYALPVAFEDELRLYFNEVKLRHSASWLLSYLMADVSRSEIRLGITVSPGGQLELAIVNATDRPFYNQYRWATAQDLGYFVSAVLQSLNVDPQAVYPVIAGALLPEELVERVIDTLRIPHERLEIIAGDAFRMADLKMLESCV